MKGIREAAMSSQEESKQSELFPATPKYPKARNDYDYDDLDYGWAPPYSSGYSEKTFNEIPTKRPGTFKISMEFSVSSIGRIADDTLPEYNYDKALIKAEEMAYDRIEEILGKNYESKYALTFNTTEGWITWEVEVELTPVN